MADAENEEQQERRKPKEINPRWKGYVCILLTSLVAFASTSNVPSSKISAVGYSISVGAVTFTISLLVLILDRFHCADYTKAFNGYFEGCTLMFCVVWWIAGISFMTRAGGLAYRALNIYFFCWLTLASCAYTLNEWSADKDILSMQELTGLSATLKSWYILMGSSFIVMASAANIHPHLKDSDQRAASLAVALSVVSFLTACSFILVHYKFFPSVASGGWLELATAFVALLFWTIGCVMQWITNAGLPFFTVLHKKPCISHYVFSTAFSKSGGSNTGQWDCGIRQWSMCGSSRNHQHRRLIHSWIQSLLF